MAIEGAPADAASKAAFLKKFLLDVMLAKFSGKTHMYSMLFGK
jgi:hypothetical protein